MAKKIGFCFSGEGARGSVQAGIALALHQKGINPDLTIGISSGSACSAMYSFFGAEGLANVWSNIHSIFDVFSFNWSFLWSTGLFNQKPMHKIMQRALKCEPVCEGIVARLNIETGLVDYVSNKEVSKEEFCEAALGAVAITALVQDRNGWVDAGSRQLTPLKQCIDYGCNEIYVILGRPLIFPQWKKPRGIGSALWMGYRALDISLYEIMLRDLDDSVNYPDVTIHLMEPKEQLFNSIMFRKCKLGVRYGLTEFSEHENQGIKNLFIQRVLSA